MANINRTISKLKRALVAKGKMPLIDYRQFYGDEGNALTKYIVHYGNGNERYKNNNIVAIVYNKVDLLKVLAKILKGDELDGD